MMIETPSYRRSTETSSSCSFEMSSISSSSCNRSMNYIGSGVGASYQTQHQVNSGYVFDESDVEMCQTRRASICPSLTPSAVLPYCSMDNIAARWILVIKQHLVIGTSSASSKLPTTQRVVNEKQFLAIMGKNDSLHKQLFKQLCAQQQQQQQQHGTVDGVSETNESFQSTSLYADFLFEQLCRLSTLSMYDKMELLFELANPVRHQYLARNSRDVSRGDLQRLIASVARDRGVMLSGELLDATVTTIMNKSRLECHQLSSSYISSISVDEFYSWIKSSLQSASYLEEDDDDQEIGRARKYIAKALSNFLSPPQLPKLLECDLSSPNMVSSSSSSSAPNNKPTSNTPAATTKWPARARELVFGWTKRKMASASSAAIPRILQPHYVRKHPLQAMWVYMALLVFIACFAYGLLNALLSHAPIARGVTTPRCQHIYAGAKGFGFNLNFWCAMLVVLMLRRTLSAIRNAPWLHRFVPVDSAVYAHKMCAFWIVTPCIIGHVSFHLAHFACLIAEQQHITFTYVDYMFTTKPNFGFLGLTVLLGWIPLLCHIIILAGALPRVRQSGYFEAFFWTHTLFAVYLTVLIFHSDKFIWFMIVPAIFYIIEKLKASRMCLWQKYGKFFVLEATLWKSGVTGLRITKPASFQHQPGDYVYINIPAIAKYEWHPFTISSAPENEAYLTLHIRSLGGWTRRLHEFMRQRQRRIANMLSEHAPPCEQLAMQASSIMLNVLAVIGGGAVSATESALQLSLDDSRIRSASAAMMVNQHHHRAEVEVAEICVDQQHQSSSAIMTPVPPPPTPSHLHVANADVTSMSSAMTTLTMLSRAIPALAQQQVQIINSGSNANTGARRTWQRRPSVVGQRVLQRQVTTLSLSPTAPTSAATQPQQQQQPLLRVYVDGPHGAPTSSIMDTAEHAVLICAGIGVTPSAAILESLVLRYKACQVSCRQCQATWTHEHCHMMPATTSASSSLAPTRRRQLKKIDFIWVVRSQAEVEWFYDRLEQLEREQALSESLRQFITIHLYITSIRGGGGWSSRARGGKRRRTASGSSSTSCDVEELYLPSLILDAALDATFEQQKVDAITGLGYRAKPGRPDWEELFQLIALNRTAGKVTVFFCGQRPLGKQLRQLSERHGFAFSKENF